MNSLRSFFQSINIRKESSANVCFYLKFTVIFLNSSTYSLSRKVIIKINDKNINWFLSKIWSLHFNISLHRLLIRCNKYFIKTKNNQELKHFYHSEKRDMLCQKMVIYCNKVFSVNNKHIWAKDILCFSWDYWHQWLFLNGKICITSCSKNGMMQIKRDLYLNDLYD